MSEGGFLAGITLVVVGVAVISHLQGQAAERASEVQSLRSAAFEMSLSGTDEARRSALVLKSWADALAAKP